MPWPVTSLANRGYFAPPHRWGWRPSHCGSGGIKNHDHPQYDRSKRGFGLIANEQNQRDKRQYLNHTRQGE